MHVAVRVVREYIHVAIVVLALKHLLQAVGGNVSDHTRYQLSRYNIVGHSDFNGGNVVRRGDERDTCSTTNNCGAHNLRNGRV